MSPDCFVTYVSGLNQALVAARTKLVNTVRGWLRAEGRRRRSGELATFSARVRALSLAAPLPTYIERQLRIIDDLNGEISEADRELAAVAKGDPVARRLMTTPGVGPATAVRFVAALDQISRFPGAHAVESYLGLVPGEDSSAERKRRTALRRLAPRRCGGVWCRRRGPRDAYDEKIRCTAGSTRWRNGVANGLRPRAGAEARWNPACHLAGRHRL
jgi:transposase